jgi:hypothetical protein
MTFHIAFPSQDTWINGDRPIGAEHLP